MHFSYDVRTDSIKNCQGLTINEIPVQYYQLTLFEFWFIPDCQKSEQTQGGA